MGRVSFEEIQVDDGSKYFSLAHEKHGSLNDLEVSFKEEHFIFDIHEITIKSGENHIDDKDSEAGT